jgi:hypothetical protein
LNDLFLSVPIEIMLSHDCCCGGGGQNFLKVLLLALAIEVADGGGEGRLVLAATTEKEEVVLEEDEDPYPPTPKYMAVQGKPKRRSDEGKQASRRLWQIVKADLYCLPFCAGSTYVTWAMSSYVSLRPFPDVSSLKMISHAPVVAVITADERTKQHTVRRRRRLFG